MCIIMLLLLLAKLHKLNGGTCVDIEHNTIPKMYFFSSLLMFTYTYTHYIGWMMCCQTGAISLNRFKIFWQFVGQFSYYYLCTYMRCTILAHGGMYVRTLILFFGAVRRYTRVETFDMCVVFLFLRQLDSSPVLLILF